MKIKRYSLFVFVALVVTFSALFNAGVLSNPKAAAPAPAPAQVQTVVNEKEALLGQAVRHIFNGYQVTTILKHYDESSDSYSGNVQFDGTIKVKVIGGTLGEGAPGKDGNLPGIPGFGLKEAVISPVFHVKGLRPYPYAERPDYAFQFVLPGQSLEPLLEIARRNAGQ